VLGTDQPENAEKEWDAVSVRVHRVEELEDKCLRPVGTDGRSACFGALADGRGGPCTIGAHAKKSPVITQPGFYMEKPHSQGKVLVSEPHLPLGSEFDDPMVLRHICPPEDQDHHPLRCSPAQWKALGAYARSQMTGGQSDDSPSSVSEDSTNYPFPIGQQAKAEPKAELDLMYEPKPIAVGERKLKSAEAGLFKVKTVNEDDDSFSTASGDKKPPAASPALPFKKTAPRPVPPVQQRFAARATWDEQAAAQAKAQEEHQRQQFRMPPALQTPRVKPASQMQRMDSRSSQVQDGLDKTRSPDGWNGDDFGPATPGLSTATNVDMDDLVKNACRMNEELKKKDDVIEEVRRMVVQATTEAQEARRLAQQVISKHSGKQNLPTRSCTL